jgi:periplasmic nitrate reductase NapE
MVAPLSGVSSPVRSRRMEVIAFLFLTVVLVPVLAVGTVGAYGFAIWAYQIYAGPPGPPAATYGGAH